jgi:hypothetical protein
VLLLLSYVVLFVHLHQTQAPAGDFIGNANANANSKRVFPKSPVEHLKEKENDFSDLLPGYHVLDHRGVVVPSQQTMARKDKQKLQEILDRLERGQGDVSSHAGNLWEISDYVPLWMKGESSAQYA